MGSDSAKSVDESSKPFDFESIESGLGIKKEEPI